MPMKRERYPANWKAISEAVRERAGGVCERCGAPNRKHIVRSTSDPAVYVVYDEDRGAYTLDGKPIRLSELPDEFSGKEVRVVLTVHHIGVPHENGEPGDPHDKMDVRPENLTALCQRCHLLADKEVHRANRARTLANRRAAGRAAVGQMKLFSEGGDE